MEQIEGSASLDSLILQSVEPAWTASEVIARHSKSLFYVDPLTVLKVIGAIIDFFDSRSKDEAEKEFRNQVLNQLTEIREKLEEIQAELVDMGVKLEAEVRNVKVDVAAASLNGELAAFQTAYPAFRRDHARAAARFDALNSAAAGAASYGPALLPTVSLGFAALVGLLATTNHLKSPVAHSLKTVWLGLFKPMMNSAIVQSLPYQKAALDSKIAEASALLDAVPVGTFRMGSHEYRTKDAYVTVTRNGDSFLVVRSEKDVDRSSREPIHGGRIGPFLSGGGASSELELAGRITQSLPPLEFQKICLGISALPNPRDVWGNFRDQGNDNHSDVYEGWLSEIRRRLSVLIGFREMATAAVVTLKQSEELATKLISFCKSA